jgi:hypothetical protein
MHEIAEREDKGAQCHSGDELEVFHGLCIYFPLITLIYTDVSRIRVISVLSVGVV